MKQKTYLTKYSFALPAIRDDDMYILIRIHIVLSIKCLYFLCGYYRSYNTPGCADKINTARCDNLSTRPVDGAGL